MAQFERLAELLDTAAPPSSGVAFDDVASRARRRKKMRLSAVASAATVVGTLSGVAIAVTSAGGAATRAAGTTTPTARTATDFVALTRHVPCPGRRAAVSPQQLAGFHAVTAVTCGQDTREFPGDGEWVVSFRRVATDGVAALQAAFERPTEPRTSGICDLALISTPPVVLVDRAGRALAPNPPLNECHGPQQQLVAALRQVTWQDVSVRKVRQVVTAQAEASGCSQAFKNMTFLYALSRAHISRGGPLFMQPPTSVHVCLYRVTGNDFEIGAFQRGFVLSATDTDTLLSALTGAGPTGNCPAEREFAAVTTDGNWATVELGGCWRVARSESTAGLGSANASVISELLRAN